MIPENQQDRDNEREMNNAEKEIEINKEIEKNLQKCRVCGVLYDPREGRATVCESCYSDELQEQEVNYVNMRRGYGEF